MTNYIWVTAQKEILHKYPNAPREVSFLRNEHRHNIHFKVYIQVHNNDRDVEFILFQRFIKGVLFNLEKDLEHRSMEMISDYLYEKVAEKFPKRKVMISVSEDNENGSLKTYP